MNFPPLFRSLHSLPFIAFHYLLSPFIAFYHLSLPFIAAPSHCPPTLCSPVLSSPRPVLSSSRPVLSSPRPVLSSPRPVLSSPRRVLSSPRPTLSPCPRIPPLHTCFPPASSPPFVSHIRLSRTIVCAPFFYSLCFTHSIVLRPLFYFFPLCFTLSHCLPPSLYLLLLFCTRFLLPGNLRKPVPDTAKGNVFLIFQRNFAKSP